MSDDDEKEEYSELSAPFYEPDEFLFGGVPEPTPDGGAADASEPGGSAEPDGDGEPYRARPLSRRREKRTGCFGGIIFGLFVICVSAALACVLWVVASDFLGFGAESREEEVVIPRGFTLEEVADILKDHGLVGYRGLFLAYAKNSSSAKSIVAGTYILNAEYDYRALIAGMTQKGAARQAKDIMFREGITMAEMFALLEQNAICYADDMWEVVAEQDFDYEFLADAPPLGNRYRLEGYLFPDTYTFWVNDTPLRVLTKMLDNFNAKFKSGYYDRAEELKLTPAEVVIVASMIEREAGTDADRPLIASVIYNRLASAAFPHLEIDATIWYGAARLGVPFSIDLDSPYNSYRNEGLPPGPISSPGAASIEAALNPASTGYYFYALHKDGSHRFFKTAAEHSAFVRSDEYGG
ncbi:MAG: endolytic transglycosylase MltG [Oscillospiraceae bacterium]|jgi:UPF0755 protein|nr:endolytic transglycosylase MltG [Oscillospiraceae bacterium]